MPVLSLVEVCQWLHVATSREKLCTASNLRAWPCYWNSLIRFIEHWQWPLAASSAIATYWHRDRDSAMIWRLHSWGSFVIASEDDDRWFAYPKEGSNVTSWLPSTSSWICILTVIQPVTLVIHSGKHSQISVGNLVGHIAPLAMWRWYGDCTAFSSKGDDRWFSYPNLSYPILSCYLPSTWISWLSSNLSP